MKRYWTLLLVIGFFSSYAQSQLVFVENKNQWNSEIDFQANSGGVRIALTSQGFKIHLKEQHQHDEAREDESGNALLQPSQNHFFQINFIGGNKASRPAGIKKSAGYYNYFIGNDRCNWVQNVSGYSEILYPEIYKGIDLRVSSLGNNLKYDFIVKPEADPKQIQIEYCGLNDVQFNGDDILLKTIFGDVVDKKPVSFQTIDGERKWISSEYRFSNNTSSFHFPDGYDPCTELVIDPLLIFSTYSGSTADNWGSTATPGENGTLYSSGITNQTTGGSFPATPGVFQTNYGGNYDIAIIKYDSTGSNFLYATYLGGSGNETPHSLLMDPKTQDLIVLGTTASTNFPTSFNAFDKSFNFGQPVGTNVIPYVLGTDLIVTRLNKFGNALIGSTYLGGNLNDGLNPPGGPLARNYGDEMRGDVITDNDGNIYISSVTNSTNFPTTTGFGQVYKGGGSDGVVVKFNSDLSSLIWSGFIGGFQYDASYSIKLDKDKNILVAGGTTSGNFPVTPGSYQTILGGNVDGWIARISSDGSSILQATFTGTLQYDQIYFIDQNSKGEIFCFGQTSGPMPITSGVYRNANSGQFLQKFSADLSALRFSTVFGSGIGIPNISPTAFLVNECDNIFMSGWGGDINRLIGYWPSTTQGMPVTTDAYQKNTSGSDFYFAVMNENATELKYATFLGGNSSKTHVDGGTSRFDKFGIVYHAVCSGCAALNNTNGPTSDFPTTPGAKSRTNNSTNCNNAAFKFDLSSLQALFQTNSTDFKHPNFNDVCYPGSIVFQNKSKGGETFIWTLGDGTVVTKLKSDTTSLVHQYKKEGNYTVKLKVIDLSTCKSTDSTTRIIRVYENDIKVMDSDTICEGTNLKLLATGGVQYSWTATDTSFRSKQAQPIVNPKKLTTYYVSATDKDGCFKKDTIDIAVVPGVEMKWDLQFISDCVTKPSIRLTNHSESVADVKFWFDFGDGQISDEEETTHLYDQENSYKIKFLAQRDFCVFEDSKDLPYYTLFAPNVITPQASPQFNDNLIVGFGLNRSPSDSSVPVSITIVDRWGKQVFQSDDYQNDWDASNVEGGIYYVTLELKDLTSCKTWLHVVK